MKTFKFIVHCKSAKIEEISRLPDTEILKFQYFLIEDKSSIKVSTFTWYTPGKCNTMQSIEINSFDKNTQKWKSSNFEMEKFQNFYGCRLVFGIVQQVPMSYYSFWKNGSILFGGCFVTMIKKLEANLNYSATFNPYIKSTKKFYDPKLKVDLMIISFSLNAFHSYIGEEVLATQPCTFRNQYMAVPPGKNYNCYEKLLLPFDLHTWAAIIFTFATAFLCTFILRFTKQSVRHFIISRSVRTPSLNVIIIFFGLSQVKLPNRNFARYLMILFIFVYLIIRTAWQGKMFE